MPQLRLSITHDVSPDAAYSFVFNRPRIAAEATPSFEDIPPNSTVMLEAEPARDEADPLTPGLRVGVELWELGHTLDHFAAQNTRVIVFYSANRLANMGLLNCRDDIFNFTGRIASFTKSSRVPAHDMATDCFHSADVLNRTWRQGRFAEGELAYVVNQRDVNVLVNTTITEPMNAYRQPLARVAEVDCALVMARNGGGPTYNYVRGVLHADFGAAKVRPLASAELAGVDLPPILG